MKRLQHILPILALIASALFCCGAGAQSCDPDKIDHFFDPENLDTSNRPLEGIVAIQEVIRLRRGDADEVMMDTMFGDKRCVKKSFLLDSSEIKSIETIPLPQQPPYCSLKLNLSDRGRKLWIGLSLPNKGVPVAFVIDGTVYRTFVPRLIYDDVTESVVIDGPFDQATARKLQSNSARNYFRLKR